MLKYTLKRLLHSIPLIIAIIIISFFIVHWMPGSKLGVKNIAEALSYATNYRLL